MRKFFVFIVAMMCIAASAQLSRLADTLHLRAEMTATASHGDFAPYWMTNNRYGLASVGNNWGTTRLGISRLQQDDANRLWQVGWGLEMAPLLEKGNSRFVMQQAYADVQYKKVRLSVGAKERPSELRNNALSSGGLATGINARPIPQALFELPDFWEIPGTRGWLAIKGRLGYGFYTDSHWQQDFAVENTPFSKHSYYHTKAGFLRIGNEDKLPVSITGGLEMNTQFGGKYYVKGQPDRTMDLWKGLGSFYDVLVFRGDDPTDGDYSNESGNVVGSWHLSIDYKGDGWGARGYAEHFFEDQSQLFWQYGWKDMLWGAEINLPKNPIVSDIVYEYLYMKHQSGPIFHDHTPNVPDQVSAADQYYFHNLYGAWQHHGFVSGSGLIISPLYNDGLITVLHTRIIAHHLGISGNPIESLSYRLLWSAQKSWGTYRVPLIDPLTGWTMMAELRYAPARCKGLSLGLAYGHNGGELLGNSNGVQLTLGWNGIIRKK